MEELFGPKTGNVPGLLLKPKRGKKQKAAAPAPPEQGAEEVFTCGVIPRYSYGARFVIRLPACAAG